MLFNVSGRLLSESATADLLDPAVDPAVKDAVKELEDDLTNNVELVPEKDMETNNAVLTAESCIVFEASFAGGRYAVDIRDIMRICEAEEEETGEAPDAGEVAADVADANDVSQDELVIVAPVDVAEEIIENCLNEAKCGKKSGKAAKKAGALSKALKEIKKKGIKIAALKK